MTDLNNKETQGTVIKVLGRDLSVLHHTGQ